MEAIITLSKQEYDRINSTISDLKHSISELKSGDSFLVIKGTVPYFVDINPMDGKVCAEFEYEVVGNDEAMRKILDMTDNDLKKQIIDLTIKIDEKNSEIEQLKKRFWNKIFK